MQRAIIIGSPGAGKSTFARKLRDRTDIPLYYLDQIWHKPDRTNISSKEFDSRLYAILDRKQWIIDGNYLRTLEVRIQACDTIYFLDYPVAVCLEGARSRIGKSREDMSWTETEFDAEFKEWILHFPKRQRPQLCSLIEKYRNQKTVHSFRSRQETDDYLDTETGNAESQKRGPDYVL